jgi:hypothetical protein
VDTVPQIVGKFLSRWATEGLSSMEEHVLASGVNPVGLA